MVIIEPIQQALPSKNVKITSKIYNFKSKNKEFVLMK